MSTENNGSLKAADIDFPSGAQFETIDGDIQVYAFFIKRQVTLDVSGLTLVDLDASEHVKMQKPEPFVPLYAGCYLYCEVSSESKKNKIIYKQSVKSFEKAYMRLDQSGKTALLMEGSLSAQFKNMIKSLEGHWEKHIKQTIVEHEFFSRQKDKNSPYARPAETLKEALVPAPVEEMSPA